MLSIKREAAERGLPCCYTVCMQAIRFESVAKVIIVNEQNQVLVLTVGEYKARPDKSFKPDFPGGLVEDSEPERDAVVREVREETGIELPADKVKLAFAETELYPNEKKSVTRLLYVCFLTETPNVVISWEHAKFDWVPVSELAGVELRPFYKMAADYCLASGILSA